jgi:hypothetical protein
VHIKAIRLSIAALTTLVRMLNDFYLPRTVMALIKSDNIDKALFSSCHPLVHGSDFVMPLYIGQIVAFQIACLD